MKYAKIQNGVVVQTQYRDQNGFIEVPDEVVPGYGFHNGQFLKPPSPFGEFVNGVWTDNEEKLKETNSARAKAEMNPYIDKLVRNEARKSAGLPPELDESSEKNIKEYLLEVQAEVDSPSSDGVWNPPLPPGVVAPNVKSLSVVVTRESGWQGKLGFRVVLKAAADDYVPTNLALAVYSGENCSGYQYTTGAFKLHSGTGEYYAVCPPGFEPGDVDIHMGLLYGAAQLSCFTLKAGVESRTIYAYEET